MARTVWCVPCDLPLDAAQGAQRHDIILIGRRCKQPLRPVQSLRNGASSEMAAGAQARAGGAEVDGAESV